MHHEDQCRVVGFRSDLEWATQEWVQGILLNPPSTEQNIKAMCNTGHFKIQLNSVMAHLHCRIRIPILIPIRTENQMATL